MKINRFTIEANTESGTLIFPVGTHSKAVAVFSSRVYADAFVRGYLAAELQVLELTSDTLPHWLANVQCFGVTHAFLDPPAGCELRHSTAAALPAVLNEVLGDRVQVVDNITARLRRSFVEYNARTTSARSRRTLRAGRLLRLPYCGTGRHFQSQLDYLNSNRNEK